MEMIRTYEEEQIGQQQTYERVIVTRSDFVWLRRHVPLSMLDPGLFYTMDDDAS